MRGPILLIRVFVDFLAVKSSVSIPVLVGSGITTLNLHQYAQANALIVGSHFKKEGKWDNVLDEQRICDVISARDALPS